MKLKIKLAALVLINVSMTAVSFAGTDANDFSLTPLSLTQENTPLVMLAMSNDHQLYYKAYPDYTDLDNDGVLDTYYLDSFDYSGYFDSSLCYDYVTSNDGFFRPVRKAVVRANGTTKGSGNATSTQDIKHSCANSEWSGNFLNWASMSRMDVVRHVLYGGNRSTDHTSQAKVVTDSTGTAYKVGYAVLERAYLPNDVHSFGKVVPEWTEVDTDRHAALKHIVPSTFEKSSGLTICSTTDDSTKLPILRVVEGAYGSWMAKESRVCDWDGAGAPPKSAQIGGDMTLRVEVCAIPDEWGSGRCKLYKKGDTYFYKPVGLLQQFGEDGSIEFGLITGSYHRNTEGGVVRSNVGKLAGNTAASNDEIDLDTGAFNASVDGIINTLQRFKIVNYSNGSAKYTDCNTFLIPKSYLKDNTDENRHCSNWGNPIAEIYYEALRYFAGNASALTGYSAKQRIGSNDRTDTDFLASLTSVTNWVSPLDTTNYCAKCSIILISSGPSSFDSDVVNDVNGDVPLLTKTKLETFTNSIGDQEFGGSFAGNQAIASTGEFCEKKTFVTGLSNEEGVCPDQPQTEGSYHLAGLAYFANISDISALTAKQTVTTYGIDLADSVPAIDFNVNGRRATLIPACQSKRNGNAYQDADYTYCSLTDIIVREFITDSNNDLISASIVVVWENSQWGNDHDMDGFERIDICTSKDLSCSLISNDEFKVTHQLIGSSLGSRLRVSYSVTGTTQDGINRGTLTPLKTDTNDMDQGWDGWSVDDIAPNHTPTSSFPFRARSGKDVPLKRERTYTVDTSTTSTTPKLLKSPLWLAAKYGGFEEAVNTEEHGKFTYMQPNQTVEWDRINNETGATFPDGVPDNYYKVRNPATLEAQLSRVFNSIIERTSSGSNASVVANRASGNGAIYQALYYPRVSSGNKSITWVGRLHSLFVDGAGLLREDTNGNGRLDDYPVRGVVNANADSIVRIYFSTSKNDTVFDRYELMGTTLDEAKVAIPIEADTALKMEELKPIWDGAASLRNLSNTDLASQRPYSDPANTGRYILTSYDHTCSGDPTQECTSLIDFSKANVDKLEGYLGYATADRAKAEALIQFTRGIDQTGMRIRTLDSKTWRLGDIVHSTPLVVEAPQDRYDLKFGDKTYQKFAQQYQQRRRVLYVGANDGMIHAFNGGYWDTICNGFFVKPVTDLNADGTITEPECVAAMTGSTSHPLGEELWAYAPKNLLSHLKWLTLGDYPHVYYVDGEPEAHDVRIFADDATHPGGWGTILVVPMRQGGGHMVVDHDNDSNTADKSLRSAYVVLDITDPEQPPELIAEITDDTLGYTLGKPALVKKYKPAVNVVDSLGNVISGGGYDNPSKNEWYLVFGSGPFPIENTSAFSSLSTQTAKMYTYDLTNKKLYKADLDETNHTADRSFASHFKAISWDGDGEDDAVYFGTIGGSVISGQTGKLFRWKLTDMPVASDNSVQVKNKMQPKVLLDAKQPVVVKPNLTLAPTGDRWVHFGTGRYFVKGDRENTEQQTMYGMVEPKDSYGYPLTGTVAKNTLHDVTDIVVKVSGTTNGNVSTSTAPYTVKVNSTTVTTYDSLVTELLANGGWQRQLNYDATNPSGRVLRDSLVYQDQLIFTEYLPSSNQCDVNGRSNLYALSWRTGTALAKDPLGTLDTTTDVVTGSVDLGIGEFAGVNIFETTNFITLVVDPIHIKGLKDGTVSATTAMKTAAGDNCIFVQSSTGEMICRRAGSVNAAVAGRQSWRELEILF